MGKGADVRGGEGVSGSADGADVRGGEEADMHGGKGASEFVEKAADVCGGEEALGFVIEVADVCGGEVEEVICM